MANWAFSPRLDYVDGILVGVIVYLVTYYLARFTWYRTLEQKDMAKLYTTGVGIFVLVFFFTWILLFTLVR